MGIANGKEISTKQLCDIMEEAYRRGKEVLPQGKVATYIPELGKADPGALGISLCARDGWCYTKRRSYDRWRSECGAARLGPGMPGPLLYGIAAITDRLRAGHVRPLQGGRGSLWKSNANGWSRAGRKG